MMDRFQFRDHEDSVTIGIHLLHVVAVCLRCLGLICHERTGMLHRTEEHLDGLRYRHISNVMSTLRLHLME
jgi:hypothetical protein